MTSTAGPVALVGSGEFLPVMAPIDAELLAGRARRAAYLPTASALEGEERFDYWIRLGATHFESLGVEPVAVPVRTRADAEDAAMARLVDGVGLIYLSGGDPHYLAATLRDSLVWKAIVRTWASGAALGGCSAGAMALSAGAPPDLAPGGRGRPEGVDHANAGGDGLGVVPPLAVIPHFDQMERWRPGAVEWFGGWRPAGTTLVGIDEDTALVHDGVRWTVRGRQAVWVLEPDWRRRHTNGQQLDLGAPVWPPGVA
jgi:cyanophycinase